MTDWFADETFWQTFYPALFPVQRFEMAEGQVEKLLGLVGCKGGTILDLACGPGRHAVVLARKGFTVTGVDLSAFLLDKAQERAVAAGVEVEWVRADMRRFRRPGAFDLCLSMFSSFGYFEEREDDRTVLRNIYESLTDGGAFLIDVVGKEWLARHFQPAAVQELHDGTLLIERREIVDDWGKVRSRWILLKEGRATEYQFQHTLYSGQELKERLTEAGFRSVRLYGDLEGNEYGPQAQRLIAVARRHTDD